MSILFSSHTPLLLKAFLWHLFGREISEFPSDTLVGISNQSTSYPNGNFKIVCTTIPLRILCSHSSPPQKFYSLALVLYRLTLTVNIILRFPPSPQKYQAFNNGGGGGVRGACRLKMEWTNIILTCNEILDTLRWHLRQRFHWMEVWMVNPPWSNHFLDMET